MRALFRRGLTIGLLFCCALVFLSAGCVSASKRHGVLIENRCEGSLKLFGMPEHREKGTMLTIDVLPGTRSFVCNQWPKHGSRLDVLCRTKKGEKGVYIHYPTDKAKAYRITEAHDTLLAEPIGELNLETSPRFHLQNAASCSVTVSAIWGFSEQSKRDGTAWAVNGIWRLPVGSDVAVELPDRQVGDALIVLITKEDSPGRGAEYFEVEILPESSVIEYVICDTDLVRQE